MSSNAITAKARCIYGRMLGDAEYAELLQRRSVSDAVVYLQGTERFKSTLRDVDAANMHRGQLEELLQKDVFEIYLRLKKFVGGVKNDFAAFEIKRLELMQIIKVLFYIEENNAKEIILSMPMYLQSSVDFNMISLASATTVDELLRVIADTQYYKVLKNAVAAGSSINRCTTLLNAFYIKWAFGRIDASYKGGEAKELKNMLLLNSDMSNIMLCYRMQKYFDADKSSISELMLPYHRRFGPAVVDEILSSSNADEKLVELLEKSYLRSGITAADNLEIEIQRYKNSRARQQLSLSQSGMTAFFSLVLLLDNERINIQKIIEGIRYDMQPSEIEKLLV